MTIVLAILGHRGSPDPGTSHNNTGTIPTNQEVCTLPAWPLPILLMSLPSLPLNLVYQKTLHSALQPLPRDRLLTALPPAKPAHCRVCLVAHTEPAPRASAFLPGLCPASCAERRSVGAGVRGRPEPRAVVFAGLVSLWRVRRDQCRVAIPRVNSYTISEKPPHPAPAFGKSLLSTCHTAGPGAMAANQTAKALSAQACTLRAKQTVNKSLKVNDFKEWEVSSFKGRGRELPGQ